MSIATVALPFAGARLFDYWLPGGLDVAIGSAVRVEIGHRVASGVVVARPERSDVDAGRLRPILEVLRGVPPLPADVLDLARFAADYYHQPLGAMLASALPPQALRRGAAASPATRSDADPPRRREAPFTGSLNAGQRSAACAVCAMLGQYGAFLLQGVTGSGKSEVYLAAASEAIGRGGQVLILVPEINLTPQLASRVLATLPGARLVVMHSGLAGRARIEAWRSAATGSCDIVLGTRLAVFAPMPSLALIVVDEEHDASFRQDDGARYHARDLAIVRARARAAPIVLGSATPSLESYRSALEGRYRLLSLATRAHPQATPPAVRLVPQRGGLAEEPLQAPALAAIELRLARGEQSLVFVNRRGFSPSLLCHACGWAASCDRCTSRLVLHRDARQLRCHHCGRARPVVVACPDCGNQDLTPAGAGTQRLEQQLAQCLPGARIARIDRDSTARRDAFASLMAQILGGEVDVLVGTQMLAKGHDFPALTLVVVLGADNALYSADFRATERLFALLMQVAGRAGRGTRAGEVLVQTDFPEHPVYTALVTQDFAAFAGILLLERQAAELPPYAGLALLSAEARSREVLDRFLAAAWDEARRIVAAGGGACRCHPPGTPTLARRAGYERGSMLLQSVRRGPLHDALREWRPRLAELAGRRVRWQIDVDPLDLG